ncbi:hypothetical protein L0222_13470 [bacterium]|nr:hypothetical protein [bacterium]
MLEELEVNQHETPCDQYDQTHLELMRFFQQSNYRILDGIIEAGQTTLFLEYKEAAPVKGFCWLIKVVLQKNHWKLETEKRYMKQ